MKNKFFFSLICILIICFGFSGCANDKTESNIWENAIYDSDTEFGTGAKSITVDVVTNEKSITFTVNTDKSTVGEALIEHNLIEGEKGAYGLYVKKVNGIEADYDKTQTFWAFCKNGESLMTGVDSEEAVDGSHYEFVYTKQ